MIVEDRLEYLNSLIATVDSAWPRLSIEIQERITKYTCDLIAAENEQTRGAIKALQELLDLPESLKSERLQINAELSERDSA